MKAIRQFIVIAALLMFCSIKTVSAEAPLPEYIVNAQTAIGQASAKSAEFSDFADAVLIAQNYLRNAETEYRKNLSWGALDKKAEPTVRYYADMALLQAKVVLSRVEKIAQEKELARLEAQATEVKAKIKVFDDRKNEIALQKGELAKRDITIAAGKTETEKLNVKIASLTADLAAKTALVVTMEAREGALSSELGISRKAVTSLEQKTAELTKSLEDSRSDNTKLRSELALLVAKKGEAESLSREQIETLNRQKNFSAEVGNLGGVIKAGSDNMTVIFGRTALLKAPKFDVLTPEGDKAVAHIVDILKSYSEFRLKLKVHGFGQGKSEDAAATDRIARLIREALLEKGKFDPATVEALGVGSAEPIYPKNNPEGNRRVEVTFVKR
jgi:outer membrane protein OmpA-like peptidoglycan-associated protein